MANELTSRARAPSALGPEAVPRAEVVARVLASLLGSYVFVWGFVSFVIALGVRVMSFIDAQTLAFLLAFLVLLLCFCWAFVAKRALHVWLVLLGGGGVLTFAAWLLTRGTA